MTTLVQTQENAPAGTTETASNALRKLRFPALGTTCDVHYVATEGKAQADSFDQAAVTWVSAFEAKYSRFQPTSLISRINDAAGRCWVEIDDDMDQMLQLCDTLFAMTKGVLDPTALPLIQLWNWKTHPANIPGIAAIDAARRLVGWNKVQRQSGRIFLPEAGMALDFGGFGKEYAVDIVAQIAIDHGITNVLVDFGHDIRALGIPPGRPAWHIGLEDPQRPGFMSESLAVASNCGIASSGDYLRNFKFAGRNYGHILDPRTGRPVANGCQQATVLADTCLQAGVLSTTAFVLGVPEGINFIQSFPRAEGLIVSGNTRAQTRGFSRFLAA